MKNEIAQQLAYLLAESLDDAKFWNLVRDQEEVLAPKRVPVQLIDEHVAMIVEDSLKLFAGDPGVRDLLHDAVMKSLEGWYEPHER